MNARRFALGLVLVAGWTLLIKFVLPMVAAARAGVPLSTWIMWDFWWAAHLALAASLRRPGPATWPLAAIVAWVEITIIVTKFWLFLREPAWTFWTANWFANKCAVLALFVAMAAWLHRGGGRALKAGA